MGYPDPGDVRLGVVFGASNELTGTLDQPSPDDVRNGIQFDNDSQEGTVILPGTSSVLSGTGYGSGGTEFTGTVGLPGSGNVRSGTTFGDGGGVDGHLVLPAVPDVRSGTVYGDDTGDPEFTGTLSPTGGGKKVFLDLLGLC
jgi:hypothetical protein